MTNYEAHSAAMDARRAVGASSAPVSRHANALQRYLNAAERAGHLTTTVKAGEPLPAKEFTGRRDLVIAGVDGSAFSRNVVEWAAAEAGRRHCALRLVHTYTLPVTGHWGFDPVREDLDTVLRGTGKALLADVADAVRGADPALNVSTVVSRGDAVTVLRRESGHARLTVIGAHGASRVSGLFFGSVALALASANPAPVAVIGPGELVNAAGPVVVGVDGSPNSDAALAFAFDEAALRQADLIAVHSWYDTVIDGAYSWQTVWLDPGANEKEESASLSKLLASWREKYPEVVVHQQLVRSRPARALLELSRTAQLVVVGSRGRGGFTGMLLGSTSQALITGSSSPVVIVGLDSLT
jgi:nucleotide-binding universal stress UspA family protein